MGASKSSDFFVRARKHRAQNRSVYGIHEDSSTELTLLSRKKCTFRGALLVLKRKGGFTPPFSIADMLRSKNNFLI